MMFLLLCFRSAKHSRENEAKTKKRIKFILQCIQSANEKVRVVEVLTKNKYQRIDDGSFHAVDSSEMAFKIAGSMGFRQGAMEANPVLLEPIMKVEVVTPEEYLGDVMGDLNRRRGITHGMEEAPAGRVIDAEVPLAEMFGYATTLRSMSQGRATYSMEFEKYNEVPQNVADTVMKKAS